MVTLRNGILPVLLMLMPTPGMTDTLSAPEIVRTFASCAGRLSAQMQHQWLLSDPAADRTEGQRAAMIDLLDAVRPEGAGREVLHHRSAARQAHAALLTRATFNENSMDAAWAQRRAEAEISQCSALILH